MKAAIRTGAWSEASHVEMENHQHRPSQEVSTFRVNIREVSHILIREVQDAGIRPESMEGICSTLYCTISPHHLPELWMAD